MLFDLLATEKRRSGKTGKSSNSEAENLESHMEEGQPIR